MIKPNELEPLPEPGQGKRGKDGYLGYLLRQAASIYRNRVDHALRDLSLTQPQFSVMTMLNAYPGHSSADLARLALLTPQTMSVIVSNLIKQQYIVRHAHPVHGRIQVLQLTESGQQMLSTAKQRVYAIDNEMTRSLSETDEAIIKNWLSQMARS